MIRPWGCVKDRTKSGFRSQKSGVMHSHCQSCSRFLMALVLTELAFLYNPPCPSSFQNTLEPPVASRCFFVLPKDGMERKMAGLEWLKMQSFRRTTWHLQRHRNTPDPTLHLQREFPFTLNTAKMGKSRKKNTPFSLVGEKCDFIIVKCVFLGVCRRSHNYLERQRGGDGAFGSLVHLPPVLHQVLPTPEPPVSPQLYAGPGRAAFQKFTCYLHFPYLGMNFPCLSIY